MTLQIDFFGYPFDDALPSFMNTDAGKFYWHRPSGRLLDKKSVDDAMTAKKYTPTSGEIGNADAWLKEHLDFGPAGAPQQPQQPVQQPPQATPSTAATAGAPGNFDNDVPADLAALTALGALGNAAAWAPGEYVTLGDGSEANWDGAKWTAGKAPQPQPVPSTAATAGAPGNFDNDVPADLAALKALGALGNGGTSWTVGQYVTLADGSEAYWNSHDWVAGKAVATAPITVNVTGDGTSTITVTFAGGPAPQAQTLQMADLAIGGTTVKAASNTVVTPGLAEPAAVLVALFHNHAAGGYTLSATAAGTVVTITEAGGAVFDPGFTVTI